MKKIAAILAILCLAVGCLTTSAGSHGSKENFPRSPRKQASHLYKAPSNKKSLEDVIRGNDSYEERLNKQIERSATKARKEALDAKVKYEQNQQKKDLAAKTGLEENKFSKLYRWYTFLSVVAAIFIVKKIYVSSQKV